jgi:hypothetical protein
MNKQTKKALKEFACRTLGVDLSDGIRNLINKKDIVFYDKNLSRKVEALVKENRRRNADGEYDWMIKIFSDSFQGMSKDDLNVDYLKFLIRKK